MHYYMIQNETTYKMMRVTNRCFHPVFIFMMMRVTNRCFHPVFIFMMRLKGEGCCHSLWMLVLIGDFRPSAPGLWSSITLITHLQKPERHSPRRLHCPGQNTSPLSSQ